MHFGHPSVGARVDVHVWLYVDVEAVPVLELSDSTPRSLDAQEFPVRGPGAAASDPETPGNSRFSVPPGDSAGRRIVIENLDATVPAVGDKQPLQSAVVEYTAGLIELSHVRAFPVSRKTLTLHVLFTGAAVLEHHVDIRLRARPSAIFQHMQGLSGRIEHLEAMVVPLGNDNVPVLIERDFRRKTKVAAFLALLAE